MLALAVALAFAGDSTRLVAGWFVIASALSDLLADAAGAGEVSADFGVAAGVVSGDMLLFSAVSAGAGLSAGADAGAAGMVSCEFCALVCELRHAI